MNVKLFRLFGPAIALVSVAACASYPAPTERLANALASIRGAQEVGASGSPQAALHLKLAQEQATQAKALMDDGKNERAEYVAQRAQVDAELALAMAREAQAGAQAQNVAEQRQMNR